jgi:hypothetical protein
VYGSLLSLFYTVGVPMLVPWLQEVVCQWFATPPRAAAAGPARRRVHRGSNTAGAAEQGPGQGGKEWGLVPDRPTHYAMEARLESHQIGPIRSCLCVSLL